MCPGSCPCPMGSRVTQLRGTKLGLSCVLIPPLIPSPTCSRASRSCRRASTLSFWSSTCSWSRALCRCRRRERVRCSSSWSFCKRSWGHLTPSGSPCPPSRSRKALPKFSLHAGRPSPSWPGWHHLSLLQNRVTCPGKSWGLLGKRCQHGDHHLGIEPCLLLCLCPGVPASAGTLQGPSDLHTSNPSLRAA